MQVLNAWYGCNGVMLYLEEIILAFYHFVYFLAAAKLPGVYWCCWLRELSFSEIRFQRNLKMLFILQVFNYWSYYNDPTPYKSSCRSTRSSWCCCKLLLAYFFGLKGMSKKSSFKFYKPASCSQAFRKIKDSWHLTVLIILSPKS